MEAVVILLGVAGVLAGFILGWWWGLYSEGLVNFWGLRRRDRRVIDVPPPAPGGPGRETGP